LNIYEAVLDMVDWTNDSFLIYDMDSDPAVFSYLSEKKGAKMMMESLNLEQHRMDIPTALNLELKYFN